MDDIQKQNTASSTSIQNKASTGNSGVDAQDALNPIDQSSAPSGSAGSPAQTNASSSKVGDDTVAQSSHTKNDATIPNMSAVGGFVQDKSDLVTPVSKPANSTTNVPADEQVVPQAQNIDPTKEKLQLENEDSPSIVKPLEIKNESKQTVVTNESSPMEQSPSSPGNASSDQGPKSTNQLSEDKKVIEKNTPDTEKHDGAQPAHGGVIAGDDQA